MFLCTAYNRLRITLQESKADGLLIYEKEKGSGSNNMSTVSGGASGKVEIRDRILSGPPMKTLPEMSIGQYLLNSMRANINSIVQIDEQTGESLTSRDILVKSIKFAGILKSRGVKMGDKIGMATENHPNWLIPTCATIFIGAVVTPLNPAYTEWEFENTLSISKPGIVFVSRRTERLLRKLALRLPWRMELIELDDEAFFQSVPTLKALLEADKSSPDIYGYQPAPIADTRKQPLVILCSSGTSGPPKAVVLSHRNLQVFVESTEEYLNLRKGDSSLVYLPNYHGYAFGMMMLSMITGTIVVVMRSFEHVRFLEAVQKYRITHLPMVPPILVFVAKHPAVVNYDFSSVREVFCGAAPLPKDILEDAKRRLGVPYILNAYGMTELSIVMTVSERTSADMSAMRLLPSSLCKVIDHETLEKLGPGRDGELCFKGERLMLGYYGNPEATRATIDQDGWLHSGDLGHYDMAGNIYISGRLKELIKYKAYQVSPSELETVLLSHPAVKDAAVMGKPDENCGELPMALVVRQPNAHATAEEIVEYVNGKFSPQKWIRAGVHFVEAIPKNPTGKIMRQELPKLLSKL
ncbi:hypothetical protein KM043_010097 [Ampulex compressa]|nr:hypothetical protein KM043_010097 [Ampulex compressa]